MRVSCHTARPIQHAVAGPVIALLLVVASLSAVAKPRAEDTDRLTRFLADKALSSTPSAPAPVHATPSAAAPGLADRMRSGASDMVVTAMNFLGVPYKRGGSSESAGFDCSGFTRHIFELSRGLILPRRVDDQASAPGLIPVKRDELQPGDLVFFNTLKRTFSHVGIYVGEGKFIHSPRTGGEVRVEEMSLAYWKKRFTGARRAEGVTPTGAPASTAAPAQATEHTPAATDSGASALHRD
jgi:cell wall-associated NlpC family hydrolase